ncbi:unnamed protein product, partial [Lymnaea stagnalis]
MSSCLPGSARLKSSFYKHRQALFIEIQATTLSEGTPSISTQINFNSIPGFNSTTPNHGISSRNQVTNQTSYLNSLPNSSSTQSTSRQDSTYSYPLVDRSTSREGSTTSY